MKHSLFIVLFALLFSCSEDPVARPNGHMRIGLPAQNAYSELPFEAPLNFKSTLKLRRLKRTSCLIQMQMSFGWTLLILQS
jgi:hypothetical protein